MRQKILYTVIKYKSGMSFQRSNHVLRGSMRMDLNDRRI